MRTTIGWSLELGAVGLLKAGSASAALLARLPAGTRIYLPALPADPPTAIEEALGLLRRENAALVPVPHVAASREASGASLESRLAAWQRASADGVREVLVVRGDPHGHSTDERTAAAAAGGGGGGGSFRTSLELLETGVLQRCGVEAVSLCGHPEGIGAAGLSADAARAHLTAKLLWAGAAGVHARVVTQFCFDASTATAYVDALRADGVDVDVSLGIVSPDVKMETRKAMALRCGVARPAAGIATPALRGIAQWQFERGEAAGAQALHLYPFGGLRKCLAAMHAFTSEEHSSDDGLEPYHGHAQRANFRLTPSVPLPDRVG